MNFTVIVLVFFYILISSAKSFDLCTSRVSDPKNYTSREVRNCGCDEKNFCIRKCCKSGYYLGPGKVCIRNETTPFKVQVFRETTVLNSEVTFQPLRVASNVTDFKIGILECGTYLLDNNDSNETYLVVENGYLWLPSQKMFYSTEEYCVDELDGLSVAVCFDNGLKENLKINVLGMIISMPFLLATFIVYAFLPDRNLHQNALMFYVITLFFSYLLLVSINLNNSIPETWCKPMGYSTVFLFLVSFFWMNVICLDIWFTFSGSRGFVGSQKSSERRRLLIYTIYAWGVPVLITLGIFLIQTFTDEGSNYNPKIGLSRCFLEGPIPNLLYFYVEAAALIVLNLVLFGLTAHKIRQVKKQTKMLKQSDSQKHNYEKDKRKFVLFVKLLLAMGVNWTMEIISFFVNWATDEEYNKIWYLTDFCNAAYGVFIFFIFVFKKKVWQLLQKRYYVMMGRPHQARTIGSSTQQTHMSSGYSSADTHVTDRTDLRSSAGTNVTNGVHIRPEEVALQRVRSA